MIESSRMTTSFLCSTSRLAFSITISATCTWRCAGSSKVERDDLALDRPLHVGDFLGPLVDEQHDQVHLGMVRRDAVGQALEQHRLARAGRRDDEAALALAERREQVHDAAREVLGLGLELDARLRVERREVLEEHLLARLLGRLEIDRFDLDQREVAFPVLRRPDLARDGVARVQIELPDLGRRHVDVVGPRQVVVIRRPQEAESVGQGLENALREDEAALLGARTEDLEDQLLLAHAGRALHFQLLGELGEGRHAHVLERGEVDHLAVGASVLAGGCLSSRSIVFHRSFIPSPVAAETGSTGPLNAVSRARWARVRSARVSLSYLVATTAAGGPSRASQS